MIDRAAVIDRLRRLAYAAPGAFREDRVFRYAALGAVAALLMLPSRPGEHTPTVPRPPGPPAPAALRRSYGDNAAGTAASTPPVGPIAPGRALNGAIVRGDARDEPDRFGTVEAARLQPQSAGQ